jgi:hypothetical protein
LFITSRSHAFETVYFRKEKVIVKFSGDFVFQSFQIQPHFGRKMMIDYLHLRYRINSKREKQESLKIPEVGYFLISGISTGSVLEH